MQIALVLVLNRHILNFAGPNLVRFRRFDLIGLTLYFG